MRVTNNAGALKQKILRNSLGGGIVVLGIMLWNHVVHGEPIDPKIFFLLPILMPIAGFMVWLRRDWVRELGRKKRAEHQGERDVEPFK